MRQLILVLAVLCIAPVFGQNKMLDSLFRELENHPEKDTVRFKLLYHISYYSYASPEDTKKYALEALDVAKELNYQKGFPVVNYMLSIYWLDQKDHQQALNYALESMRGYERTNHKKGIYNTTEMIAGIYMSWRDYPKAEQFMEQMLTMSEKDSTLADFGNLYHNLGIIYSMQKKFEEGLTSFQKALAIRAKRNDIYGQSVAHHDLAETLVKVNRKDEAAMNFTEALKLGKKVDNTPVIGAAFAGLAQIQTSNQRYKEAHVNFDSALYYANQIRDRKILLDCYKGLSRLFVAEGNFKKALEFEQMNRVLNDSIFNEEKAALLTEAQTKYETEKKEQAIQILERDKKIESITKNILIAALIVVIAAAISIYRVRQLRERKNLELLNVRIDYLTLKHRELLESRMEASQDALSIEGQDERFLKKALEVVESNLDCPQFGVEKMAEEMGMSRANLLRKLKSSTMLPPSEFIRSVRLKRAATLLRSQADSVSQIGFMVGFEDQSYFAKSFRKQFGVSPTEYSRSVVKSA